MTLRLRLVAALVLLAAVALAIFASVTTRAYDQAQRDNFDRQLDDALPRVSRELFEGAGLNPERPGHVDEPSGPLQIPAGFAARLYDERGEMVADLTSNPDATPDFEDVEDQLEARGRSLVEDGRIRGASYLTVESEQGSGSWRVLVAPPFGAQQAILAAPLSDVEASTRRLVAIEAVGAAMMLLALGAGSWLIVRRGLRPLEAIATQARSLNAGELDRRVEPADNRTEVGSVGLAINSMLDRIQAAFDEKAATEAKLRQFLADASHELRTPLTSIRGFAEIARHAQAEPEQIATALGRIEAESERMGRLVQELLLLARLDQHREPERASVDLVVLADEVCANAVATFPDRSITLDASAPLVVTGDPALLRQALSNLVDNALRHAPAPAAVEVTLQVIGHFAEVEVADTGPGIPAAALGRVFDRFWQADPSRASGGSGLGLAIVAAVAQQHGGSVRAANRGSEGARFTLIVPLDGVATKSSEVPRSFDADSEVSPSVGVQTSTDVGR